MAAYMRIDSIEGPCAVPGYEGWFELHAVDHLVNQEATDDGGGSTGGKVLHMPIVVTKAIDQASALLNSVVCRGTKVPNGEIVFTGGDPGKPTRQYLIALTDVAIVSCKTEMVNSMYPENAGIPVREKLALSYSTIVWTSCDEAGDSCNRQGWDVGRNTAI